MLSPETWRQLVEPGSWLSPIFTLVDRLGGPTLPPVVRTSPQSTIRDCSPEAASEAVVSVIIPCFNYGHYLNDSVTSALSQKGVRVEVIVVDDASTDSTAEVSRDLASRDSRVVVCRLAQNAGHVRAFNTGLSIASGEFIVRLDADDLLTTGSLRRAVDLFRAYPTVGLVYGHPRHFSSPVPPQPHMGRISWTVWRGHEWLLERSKRGVNCITTPEAMLRGDLVRDLGPLRTELQFAQDMEMWLRVSAFSDVGRVAGVDQALHRDHAKSMSATVGAGVLTDLHERRRVFELVYAQAQDRLPLAEHFLEMALATLASEALERVAHAIDRGREDREPIDELVTFSRETYPEVTSLSAWTRLERRRAHARKSLSPLSLSAAGNRRLRAEMQYLRWTRQGV